MDYILQTEKISKAFGRKMAVDHVSLGVREGDIYGFIGENGAGKTTLMRMVCGLAEPNSGGITLFGSRELVAQRHKMGSTIENAALYPAMTALENMEAQRLLLGIKDKKASATLLDIVGLSKTEGKKTKDFSLGMKQRLMIALALLGNPVFLVLDEPTNGLDPMGIKEIRNLFQQLNEQHGTTILISSHILGELEKIATCYGIISNGKMVDEFRADELQTRCGKNLLMYTGNPQKTAEIISNMFPDAELSLTAENAVYLKGHVEDAANINKQLVTADITVKALAPDGEDLESYFIRLMGGRKYV